MEGTDNRRGVLFAALQWGNSADGGLASLSEVIERLRTYRAVVLTNRNSPLVERWRSLGIEVAIVPESASRGWRRNAPGSAASYVRWARVTRRIVQSRDIAVIHANDPLSLQLSFAGRAGRPIIFNLRDTLDPERATPRRRFSWLFRMASHVLFNSRDMGERWQTICPAVRGKWSATYSVVNRSTFAPAAVCGELPPVVLVSGVICNKKNQLWFLQQVAPPLVEQGVQIWFAGDFRPETDAYSAACATAAASLGDGIRFLGYRSDVATLMRRAIVVAVPSRYEGLMRTMIEAMSVGRPVVSTDVASAREMLEQQPQGAAGMVVAMDDAEAMAGAIRVLVDDRALAERLGRQGSSIAAALFQPEQVIAAYESAYDRVTGQPEPAA